MTRNEWNDMIQSDKLNIYHITKIKKSSCALAQLSLSTRHRILVIFKFDIKFLEICFSSLGFQFHAIKKISIGDLSDRCKDKKTRQMLSYHAKSVLCFFSISKDDGFIYAILSLVFIFCKFAFSNIFWPLTSDNLRADHNYMQ